MSDKAIETAKALRKQLVERKAALRKERDAIDIRLNDVEKFIALHASFAVGDTEILELFAKESNKPATKKQKTKRIRINSKKEDIAEAARVVIAGHGKPVMRSALFKELIEQGYTIEGTNPEMVLSTMLWRMKDKVVRLKQGGYWLAERPWEQSQYMPSPETLKRFETEGLGRHSLEAAVDMFRNLGNVSRETSERRHKSSDK
jgi:hypothetical protein